MRHLFLLAIRLRENAHQESSRLSRGRHEYSMLRVGRTHPWSRKPRRPSSIELLRRARLERGWTQKVVAERIGAPNDMMVARWETGKAFPSAYYVERLCQLFEQKASALGLLPERQTHTVSQRLPNKASWPSSLRGQDKGRSPPLLRHSRMLSRRRSLTCL